MINECDGLDIAELEHELAEKLRRLEINPRIRDNFWPGSII